MIEKMSFIEQPIELIVAQLQSLPLEDVLSACESNPKLVEICNTKTFWFSRLARDFPDMNARGNPDPKALYIQLYQNEKRGHETIEKSLQAAKRAGHNVYWQIDRPTRYLKLTRFETPQYVQNNYPGREDNERFVYWPDYRVVGTVNNIVRKFKELGIRGVDVAELNQRTEGQRGYSSGRYPLTSQLVYDNSIDPVDPNQLPLIDMMRAQDFQQIDEQNARIMAMLPPVGGTVQGFSNGYGDLQTRKQNFLNSVLQNMPADEFRRGLILGDDTFLGYQSYDDFVNTQVNIINGFNEDGLRTLDVLLNQIVPMSSYLDGESAGLRTIRGLVFDRNNRIVFVERR